MGRCPPGRGNRWFRFLPLLLPLLLPFAARATTGEATAEGEPDRFRLAPSPQRSGRAARGFRYLVEGDYVRSGPPLSMLLRSAPYDEPGFARGGDNDRLPYWLTATTAPNGTRVATPNCLQCHADRLNGRLIVGLGNATRDYSVNFALGTRVTDNEIAARFGRKSPEREAFATVRDVLMTVGPQIRTRVEGVNPADKLAFVLAAHRDPETLEWSDEPLLELPDPEHVVPTDVPALWLLRKKNAMFHTGLGRGDFARLMMAASLLTLRDADEVRAVEDDFVDVLEWIRQLEPPPWPGPVDGELAAAGREVFAARCTPCHGSYGRDESYPNLLVRLEKIGTDPWLAEEQFSLYAGAIEAFNRSWFARGPHAARLVPERGYVAPPLDGVWATAPYLHNGSVPSLVELLDSGRRPAFWKRRRRAASYDFENVGVRYRRKKWAANPSVYDTTAPGYGNAGHTFGDALGDAERHAVIEYLKTL